MQIETYHLLLLAIAGGGQSLLLAFAWGFLGVVLLYKPLTISYVAVARLMYSRQSETTLVVTLVGTILSVASTACFSIALKEALRYRMHKPISLIKLTGGITMARGGFLISFRHIFTTLATFGLFALMKLMVSSWATLLTPTLVALNVTSTGTELDLDSGYFETQLGEQLLSGGALLQGNSVEIIDTDGLLSGIATAQYNFRVRGVLSFNGVLYNVSTGGVLPAAPGFLGSNQAAQPNNTGLGFVGGRVSSYVNFPPYQALFNNFTILQQGLTADVRCSEILPETVSTPLIAQVPVDIFNGNTTFLNAYAYSMTCGQGASAHQDYVIRATDQLSAAGLVYSLVCPYPVGQSNLDWSKFNVTSQGNGKYMFLQPTNCEITPKLTTSLVTYASDTLNATVLDSTPLSSNNSNLALFLASIIDYHSKNAQGLTANSIGDALYSIAVATNTSLDNGPMDPRLLGELEQYWRGVIEFSGTYLRSGFSASPITIPSNGSVNVVGNQTITTMGWSKHSPIYLYTVLPVTLFSLLTYVAVGYALWHAFLDRKSQSMFATFDPTDPLHLIMVSSTRVSSEKEAYNLEGETLGGFDLRGILDNEDLVVQLVNMDGVEERLRRKRFMNWTRASQNA